MVRGAILLLGLLAGAVPGLAQPAPSLRSAASFAVLGGSAVSSSGTTTVAGNLGVHPGASVTGSPTVTLGKIYRNDATARQAQKDAAVAYGDLAGRTCTSALTEDLGGMTLTPGVYCFSSSAQLTGNLTLDAVDSKEAVWIFRIADSLTTSAGSAVSVVNGGSHGNVFWQVGGSATLGERTVFTGSILALGSITLKSGASVSGRLLARAGAVTLDANAVSVCCKPITVLPPTLPGGTVGTSYSSVTFKGDGGDDDYTFKVLSGTLPPGLTPLPSNGVLSGTPTEAGVFRFTIVATDGHGCSGIREYEISIAPCPIIVLPETLPNGRVGVRYHETIVPKGTKVVDEELLPPGLKLESGVLRGLPTTPGKYTFMLTASEGLCSGSRSYTIVICGIAITTPTLPAGCIGVPYSETIATAGGVETLTFSTRPSSLPPGLTLDPAKGILSGTPSTARCFTFTVTVTDSLGCSDSHTYTLCICPRAILLSDIPTEGTVGAPYVGATIMASGGEAPYQLAVTTGAPPRGVVFHPRTGVLDIDGTPTLPGRFVFTVTATDARGCVGHRDYVIAIDCPPIVLSPSILASATFGELYCQTLTAAGGIGPYAFSVTGGNLPLWLSLSEEGVLSGIPSIMTSSAITPFMPVPGTTFTVTARDKISGCSGEQTYAIVVHVCAPPITISPPTLPAGTVGVPYSETITASGAGPYTFAASCGALPAGMALSPAGLLSETPLVAGTYVFTVTATESVKSCSTAVIYTLVIAPGG